MRKAYALLGLAFALLFIGTWLAIEKFKENKEPEITTPLPMSQFSLTSPVFENGQSIPAKYTCDGENISPPLVIKGVPEGTKSLVLVVDDPDVPKQLKPDGMFDHWVLYGIDPTVDQITEGAISGAPGRNGRGETAYTGPCPPTEYEPTKHRYYFKLYAVDTVINFTQAPTKDEVVTTIEGHILAQTQLMGTYDRKKQ